MSIEKSNLCKAWTLCIRVNSQYIDYYKGKTALILLDNPTDVREIQALWEVMQFFNDKWLSFILYIGLNNILSYLWWYPSINNNEKEIDIENEIFVISNAISTQLKRFNINVEFIITNWDTSENNIKWILQEGKTPFILDKSEGEWIENFEKTQKNLLSDTEIHKLLISNISTVKASLSGISMLSLYEAKKRIEETNLPENLQKYVKILINFVEKNPLTNRGHLIKNINDLLLEIWTTEWIWLMIAAKIWEKINDEKVIYWENVDQVNVETSSNIAL